MAKLRRRVIYTDIRWEETEELTSEQLTKWKSEDEDLQDEVMDEVDFELVNDNAQVRIETARCDGAARNSIPQAAFTFGTVTSEATCVVNVLASRIELVKRQLLCSQRSIRGCSALLCRHPTIELVATNRMHNNRHEPVIRTA